MLLEPQFFASFSRVIRIENTSDILCPLPSLKSIIVLSSIKCKKVKFIKRK